MHKNFREIIRITIRNRRSVWLDNDWDADVNEMMGYIENKYNEYWGYLEEKKITSERAINICCQLVDMAEKHFKKISKERDLEYGKRYA